MTKGRPKAISPLLSPKMNEIMRRILPVAKYKPVVKIVSFQLSTKSEKSLPAGGLDKRIERQPSNMEVQLEIHTIV
jgi:hypothetical protein